MTSRRTPTVALNPAVPSAEHAQLAAIKDEAPTQQPQTNEGFCAFPLFFPRPPHQS